MQVSLQEHPSNCLLRHIKGKAGQATELVKVQSLLCMDAVRLNRVIVAQLQRSVEQ